MLITYQGPHRAVYIAPTGQKVARGDTVEVTDELGANLARQGDWSETKTAPPKPTGARRTTKTGTRRTAKTEES